nr:MAG TPA: hypothetical protein [Caudoviricetes sp.]
MPRSAPQQWRPAPNMRPAWQRCPPLRTQTRRALAH